MKLSVAVITLNEERNLARTLESVRTVAGEVIVVDCGSSDNTVEIARSFGALVFVEEWKGYAAQKNSAIAKCTGDWILSLDADEAVSEELAKEIETLLCDGTTAVARTSGESLRSDVGSPAPAGKGHEWCRTMGRRPLDEDAMAAIRPPSGYFIPRKNLFLGRWIRHGGFWPDAKLRLFRRGLGWFEERAVHETMRVDGPTRKLKGPLVHHAYPTLDGYLSQMNHYSSLGAEISVAGGPQPFRLIDIAMRPALTFVYNYFCRFGFLDGKEGLLLHLYHSGYVSWKYAKAWEKSRRGGSPP